MTRPECGRLRQSFVFAVHLGDRSATLLLRDGFVTEEFIDLAGKPDRDVAEETRLDELKADLAGVCWPCRPTASTRLLPDSPPPRTRADWRPARPEPAP
ncbi:hypothetical protein I553_1445 [Mycobacterium xenopi 4042]|uniref:Uncharacterized protein n=1 Tax=Mycobacterium xenopi 4042 TaxID=1299334 RepID=X8CGQ1_MYCXE|nr:hypothetical protein I553_1445 [Mycobacterium xenopi 4042]